MDDAEQMWSCMAQVLEHTNRSLQHLLQAFCGVATDKSFQQADWTERSVSLWTFHRCVYVARTVAHL